MVGDREMSFKELSAVRGWLQMQFSMMDADRSDSITYAEFERGVAMCGVRPVPRGEELRALFESFDRNQDGTLSYREMLAAVEGDRVEAAPGISGGVAEKEGTMAGGFGTGSGEGAEAVSNPLCDNLNSDDTMLS